MKAACHAVWPVPVGVSAWLALGAACSSSSGGADAGTGPSDASSPTVDAGAPDEQVGAFLVRLVEPTPADGDTPAQPGYTAVLGRVSDGPTPSPVIWDEVSAGGDCRLLTPRVPFCATPCGGSAACVEDDVCQRYPAGVSVGTVRVIGLAQAGGATELVMEPIANNYQPAASVELEYPPFPEGATVRIEASGGAHAPFSVEARGVAPLALTRDTFPLERGSPLDLAWVPPTVPGLSRIHVKLDISHHGGSKGMITCETEDDGGLELDAGLVTELMDLGIAGFPTIIVTRAASGEATMSLGRVLLTTSADVERPIAIPGLSSCTDDRECPMGQSCQSDLTCG